MEHRNIHQHGRGDQISEQRHAAAVPGAQQPAAQAHRPAWRLELRFRWRGQRAHSQREWHSVRRCRTRMATQAKETTRSEEEKEQVGQEQGGVWSCSASLNAATGSYSHALTILSVDSESQKFDAGELYMIRWMRQCYEKKSEEKTGFCKSAR